MSALLSFFRGGSDDRGRTLDEILTWNRDRLEYTHDYIQWLFPLRDRSGANPSAPVLSDADVQAFHSDPALQHHLRRALRLMLDFYGLQLIEPPTAPPQVIRRETFETFAPEWLQPGNHNFLRLTRILKSLQTLGLQSHARATFEALRAIYDEHGPVIGRRTFDFWLRTLDA
jgi:hypothetical protein